ncbi:TonB family protein [Phaeovulum vinaykumarii]|uniref:Outer membrane transport energization protein TonB n=1 Tax=Phaeovulum vinaykumarii TaxID=407234 RepID=A0A1N7JLK3_9RHOB|nr:TonB family protein [Phaeovulum vinaykumarii]SIS50185.1 outer membrane transport energization protein TonB [Phaeovulum vinaykumarii]SOB90142.1 outer membrane transport energization protein TonB [Phaeovulum vinaykumarii]
MSARRTAEIVAFTALALALHGAAFGVVPRPDPAGVTAAGSGGQEVISLEAVPASVQARIDFLDRPRLPAPQMTLPDSPPRIEVPLRLPAPTLTLPATAPVIDLPRIAPLPVPPADLSPAPPQETQPVADLPPEARIAPPEKPARPDRRAERPRPAPAPATAPQQAQRAAGAGGGAAAGTAGPAASRATLSPAQQAELRASWGAAIRARIEHRKSYPAAAGRAAGVVTLRLTVARSGALAGAHVARSSGHAALDAAALAAVRRAGHFPAAPRGLSAPQYTFSLGVRFAR